jgi:hypothetical protein
MSDDMRKQFPWSFRLLILAAILVVLALIISAI